MYSVPKGKCQWIRNDEFVADFGGFIPELRDLVEARCGNRTVAENKDWETLKYKTRAEQAAAERSMSDAAMKEYEAQLKCERNVQDELTLRAYGALRNQNGEIPQSTLGGILPPLPK